MSILGLARAVRGHVHGRLRGRDAGAVATLVAIMLGTGVILGCAALTIDTGSLLWERRQLQNGADAASLSAAKSCADLITSCPTLVAAGSPLANLAGANASDNATSIENICYSPAAIAANSTLAAYTCPASGSPSQLVNCPPVAASLTAANYVEVRTKTLTSGGSSILPPYLAQTLAGGGYSGETVKACARAAWGPPTSMAITVPITLSDCEWENATLGTPHAATPTYAPDPVGAWPGYGGAAQPAWPAAATTPPVAGNEVVIMLQDPSSPQLCTNWAGHDVAGGFGYLNSTSCSPNVSATNWNKVDPGSGWASLGCDLGPYWKRVIYLPVFDCVVHQNPMPGPVPPWPANCYDSPGGGNHWYHIEGFAKFYLSGYKLSGAPAETRATPTTGSAPCTGPQRCLSGWFLDGPLLGSLGGPPPPGPPLGPYVVQVAG
ncbi:Tad domain-containing protein [Oryzihumus leptocrescens]|uniref:Tad domain-containing protein n=1 Tax=Oryzihumus leptocrescens TaxID=297536 RepID=UPI0016399E66|nr:Tad domain-containing protein [Oryzihumus leptocrescens]